MSFYSGHSSTSFAAATALTIEAYEFHWLSDGTRWVVPALAYSAAASVGYLRIASDNHWASDVAVGAAMGTGVTWLVYELRTRWLR
jgi:membrane-associated phospholipid phosphatase